MVNIVEIDIHVFNFEILLFKAFLINMYLSLTNKLEFLKIVTFLFSTSNIKMVINFKRYESFYYVILSLPKFVM